jgi:hypothetical protein
MTYQEQLLIIKDIPIREGDTKVITCPFCYQAKKLALSKIDGKLMWHCYRASCSAKGIHTGKRSIDAVKSYLANDINKKASFKKPLPSMTTSVLNHQPAIDYLEANNSMYAYENGLVDVRYAPAEDRVMFCSGEGAVGRSLKSYGPKWITYGAIPDGIHVGKGDTAVLVEDAPSACSVSRIDGLVGVALLGTNFTNYHKKAISKYTQSFLVLDKDAALKAIAIQRCANKSLLVRLTNTDLKCLTTKQITKVLSYG